MKRSFNVTNKTFPLFSFFLFYLVSISPALAEFDPAKINAGGIEFIPVVGLSESYDSNILYTPDNEESSLITVISPQLLINKEIGVNNYSLEATAEIGQFADSNDDNYVDSSVKAIIHQSFTRKANLDLEAYRLNEHESRGTGNSAGGNIGLTSPDEYHINGFSGKFSYGSQEAIGNIVIKLFSNSRRYDTRRDVTNKRDQDDVGGVATFFYHMMPKTSLLAEISHREISYETNPDFNSFQQRAFFGASWNISAITKGTAKAGLLEKNFDDMDKGDVSAFSWELGARWTPLSYSVIDVLTSGKTEETNGAGDYIDSKVLRVQWIHFWNDRMNTTLNLNSSQYDYKPSTRKDKLASFSIGIIYNFKRWLDFGVSYSRSDNQSTVDNFDYQKNVFTLSLTAGL